MIVVKADEEIKALMKSFGGKKNFSRLHKVPVTDKNGHTRMVWVKNDENKPGMKPAKKVDIQEKVHRTVMPESTKPAKQLSPTYGRKQIPASKFKAAEYKQVYDDETINADSQQGMDNAIKAILELPIVKKHPEFEMKFR